jgi:hypothetical protein
MKQNYRFLLLLLIVPMILLTDCKKDDEDITYTYTIVPLTILGYSSAPTAVLNQDFVRQLPATGGKPPYTWTLVEGSLPPGLALDSRGRVYGRATSTGQYIYTLRLTDSKGATATSQYTQNISGSGTTPFMLGTPQIPPFGEDQDVGYLFFAQGGVLPWTFAISGLPAGLTYDPATGLIYGTPTEPFSGSITVALVDALGNPASGSPVTVSFAVNAPVPTGGGGGGNPVGCNAYEGKYIGQFEYIYHVEQPDHSWKETPAAIQLTLQFECLASSAGSTILNITHAVCSDARFGCQLGGCTPSLPSIAIFPEDPPANSSNPSQDGQGVQLFFPNGATLGTSNGAGHLNVSSDGRTISNSLDPSIQNNTWVAIAGDFGQSVPPNGPTAKWKSWILTWSNTLKEVYRPLLSTVPGNPCTDSCNP